MFKEVLKGAVLSPDELKPHLKGTVPDDLKISEDNERCICYVYSQIGRTAIVLTEGKLSDKPKVRQEALDMLFELT